MKTVIAGCTLVFFLLCVPLSGEAVQQMPLRVQMFLSKVYPLVEKKQYSKAISKLNAFRARANTGADKIHEHPQVNLMLGNCYQLMKHFKKASAAYRRVVKRNPSNISGWQNLGTCAYELEQYEEAGYAFQQAYTHGGKTDAQLLYYGALTMLMAEKYNSSITLFQKLLARHPKKVHLPWKENLVYAYLAINQNKKALPHIRALANGYTGKKQRQWREILLQQYLTMGLYTQARRFGIDLTRLEPGEPLWWKSLCHVYLQQNNMQGALQALTIYRYLHPLSHEETKLIADLYMQLGIPVKAVADYEVSLKKRVDMKIVKRLIYAYMEIGEIETALARLEHFDPKGKQHDLHMLKADILYALKRYEEAGKSFADIAQGRGSSSTIGRAQLMLAYCHWQLHHMPESLAAFKKAAAYKRFKNEAKKAITQLEAMQGQEKKLVKAKG